MNSRGPGGSAFPFRLRRDEGRPRPERRCVSGRHPCRWSRDAAASRSPTRFRRRWSKWPASRSSCGNWITSSGQVAGEVVLCVEPPGRADRGAWSAMARALGLRVRYAFDGPVRLGTGGALRQALPLLGERVLRALRRFLSCRSTSRRCKRAFVAERRPALMTVLQEPRPLGQEQCGISRTAWSSEYNKHRPRPEMASHRLRIEHSVSENARSLCAGTPFDLARRLSRPFDDGTSGWLRGVQRALL